MLKNELSFIGENMKTYYFFMSTIGTIAVIFGFMENIPKFIYIPSVIIAIGAYLFSLHFLLFGHRSKRTKEERAKIYKEGYDHGRFDEEMDKTYSMGKYANESDSPFKGNCPDCSYPLPNNIGLCHTGECKKLRWILLKGDKYDNRSSY
ncbi:hypothetical protein [Paenibacillus naphthalenovorans]|uniref:Uncharacterized protein n=1 Tax=Paenibacillus naphthalenovorans TaxID=162209 RepID=A0A0U2VN06_9BACL|nr:hypothetical protein [Paenibacillus naphthalenovorans]ALS22102.1 hypothetical protein IJ22_17280 [Paenibacillus naphthalenovorans]